MSRHNKERNEKICLNCNAATYGRYCHVCGQENIETTESFWHLLQHFVFDLFHFDGKFWVSVKYLLTKPGFLAKEYIRGRRVSYLHPIRMYIFVNTIFFLIFFSFYNKPNKDVKQKPKKIATAAQKIVELEKYKAAITRKLKDSVYILQQDEFKNYLLLLEKDISAIKNDSAIANYTLPSNVVDTSSFYVSTDNTISYNSFEQYDSFQNTLPKKKRDGYLKTYFAKKGIEYKMAAKEDKTQELKSKWIEMAIHSIPKILFVSMPFFALILMLLYVRNSQYFYVHHIIFTLYFYCGIFIINLLQLWSNSLSDIFLKSKEGWFLDTFWGISYLLFIYKSFKNFYLQSRIKTILKLISVVVFIIVLIVLLTFLGALLIKINI